MINKKEYKPTEVELFQYRTGIVPQDQHWFEEYMLNELKQ